VSPNNCSFFDSVNEVHCSYLVDSASHMLVSKVKPCKSKQVYCETANGSLISYYLIVPNYLDNHKFILNSFPITILFDCVNLIGLKCAFDLPKQKEST
jgi:hypothetical protein